MRTTVNAFRAGTAKEEQGPPALFGAVFAEEWREILGRRARWAAPGGNTPLAAIEDVFVHIDAGEAGTWRVPLDGQSEWVRREQVDAQTCDLWLEDECFRDGGDRDFLDVHLRVTRDDARGLATVRLLDRPPGKTSEYFSSLRARTPSGEQVLLGRLYRPGGTQPGAEVVLATRPPTDLVGLALSGGGIRSATFCLGLLQGLERLRLLPVFDYLSTVSGGGYVGGWWSGWLARRDEGARAYVRLPAWPNPPIPAPLDKRLSYEPESPAQPDGPGRLRWEGVMSEADRDTLVRSMQADPGCAAAVRELYGRSQLFPPPERVEPERAVGYLRAGPGCPAAGPAGPATAQPLTESGMTAGDDPVHHLRLFSNFLTPRKGALSGDTWRAAAVVVRNLALTWLVLLPILFLTVLAARVYFIWEPSRPLPSGGVIAAVGPAQDGSAAAAQLFPGAARAALDSAQRAIRAGGLAMWMARADFDVISRRIDQLTERLDLMSDEQRASDHGVALRGELDSWKRSYVEALRYRALHAARPLIVLAAWLALLTLLWLCCLRDRPNKRDVAMVIGGVVALAGLGLCVAAYSLAADAVPDDAKVAAQLTAEWLPGAARPAVAWASATAVAVVGGVLLFLYVFWPVGNSGATESGRNPVRRGRIAKAQAALLALFCATAAVLAVAGFSWEGPMYMFTSYDVVASAGGWAAVLSAVGGALYTVVAASPTGGGDHRRREPSPVGRVVFAVTPVLVLLVLAAGLSGLAFRVLKLTADDPTRTHWLTAATFIGVMACFFFAGNEIRWRTRPGLWPWVLLGTSVALLVFAGIGYHHVLALPGPTVRRSAPDVTVVAVLAALAVLVAGLILFRLLAPDLTAAAARRDTARRGWRARAAGLYPATFLEGHRNRAPVVGLLLLAGALAGYFGGSLAGTLLVDESAHPHASKWLLVGQPFAALSLCLLFVVFELYLGEGKNQRTLGLLMAAWLIVVALVAIRLARESRQVIPPDLEPKWVQTYVAVHLMALSFCWVVALGWAADPNALSLHAFYRSRLVRAYLGASNPARARSANQITDSVPGDDVPLSDLRGCRAGGPYHLVNTTLNLVATRDVATAQRSAAAFLLSARSCGSVRTGYRPTAEYMGGRMTLGTAVAVSGAAASPNMGSKSYGSALAMLMTLLNIRLGFWAPNPNGRRWQSPQARLWPYHTFREFASQTNDLGTFCYLTDGGHFDNTGVYSLVERGCRYIVAADCGADPDRGLQDLGDLIRRCRIDFGAEISLDVRPLTAGKDHDARPFVVGTIEFDPAHLAHLRSDGPREGVIVWFKPRVTAAIDRADVRQYRRQSRVFPQQTTADQWFDEAQFESYRQHGESAALAAFAPERVPAIGRIGASVRDGTFDRRDVDALFQEVRMIGAAPAGQGTDAPDPARDERAAAAAGRV